MVVADGTMALAGTPAELPPPIAVTPMSRGVEPPAGIADSAIAVAAGVVTCTSCWRGVATLLAGVPLAGVTHPPGAVGVRVTLQSLGEVRPACDSALDAVVAADATFAQTVKTDAHATSVRPKK
ncbi:MAG TPA: hypothetical protein VMJ65_21165 [Solirubrobacteraceae bacterium]|nr:hypothetical protein [Solirubrobacteraceae bacterium]